MKEMVGGCCVCSDERGWPENPLVYCDGQNCTVAVHQACYGIVTVPTGPWYCRKCESQERAARVRCELCPSRDGALKKTDNQGWAHVVCALYIPEVRFGNVTTMEPIILQLIPAERYSKACYICQEVGKGSRANVGACMQCNKSGCKQQFHVTCAQTLGLLCEEAGNYLDNVKYCGYCQHHYSKLKKGGNVKTIPPYKPVTHETGSSDPPSSPEKETDLTSSAAVAGTSTSTIKSSSTVSGATSSSSSSSSKQRKSSSASKNSTNSSSSLGTTNSNTTNSSSSIINNNNNSSNSKTSSSSSKDKEKHSKSLSKVSSSNKSHEKESREKSSKSSKSSNISASSKDNSVLVTEHATITSGHKSSQDSKNEKINMASSLTSSSSSSSSSSKSQTPIIVNSTLATANVVINAKDSASSTAKEVLGQKFTTSNFTETVVVKSESVFGNDGSSTVKSPNTSSSTTATTTVAKKRKADINKMTNSSSSSSTVDDNAKYMDLIKDVSVTLVPLPHMDKIDITDVDKTNKKAKTGDISSPLHVINEPNLQNVNPNLIQQQTPPITISTSKQQVITQNVQQHQIIKAPVLKDLSEIGRQQQQATFSSPSNSAGTQSLVVSVPLSTATMSGINIPATNATSVVSTSQNNSQAGQQQQQQHLYQQIVHNRLNEQLSQNTSINRSSPIVTHNQTHQSIIIQNQDRQSPIILHNATGTSPSIIHQQHSTIEQDRNTTNSKISVLQSVSPVPTYNTIHSITTTASTTVSNIVSVGSNSSNNSNSNSNIKSSVPQVQQTNVHTMESGVLKISYEKQPNTRVAILQEEAPGRRSRSQSGDNTSSRSRSSKKRSATSSTSSTSSSISSASSSLPSPALATASAATASAPSSSLSSTLIDSSTLLPSPTSATTTTSITTINNSNNNNNTTNNNNNNYNNIGNNNNNNNNNSINNVVFAAVSAAATAAAATMSKKTSKTQQLNETPLPSTSRTPDTSFTSSSFGGLKFSYEAQSGGGGSTTSSSNIGVMGVINQGNVVNSSGTSNSVVIGGSPTPGAISSIGMNQQIPTSITPQPTVKDSPPSSPGSEAGSRKRTRKSSGVSGISVGAIGIDSRDIKIFQNGVHASHMLGNQLNPASSVAQKMSDQLHMEMEAHSVYTAPNMDTSPQLIGPPFPGKQQSSSRSSSTSQGATSFSTMLSGGGNPTAGGNNPQSLEQLLERQWEQGSQFLMEQAQHFDIASLLSCLHQLRTENVRLEDHVNNLLARRDHLLAVNARLAIPLNPPVAQSQPVHFNNIHVNGPTEAIISSSRTGRSTGNSGPQSTNAGQQNFNSQLPVENGIDFRHTTSHSSSGIRHSPANQAYSTGSHNISNRQQGATTNPEHLTRGRSNSSSYQSQQQQQQQQHQQQQQQQNVYNASVAAAAAAAIHQQSLYRSDDSQVVKPS